MSTKAKGLKLLTQASSDLKNTMRDELNKTKKPDEASTSEKKGGRPTNEEKGIKSRKQYTLTLKEDTYKLILESARLEDLSFAKFMERAALEYIEKHK